MSEICPPHTDEAIAAVYEELRPGLMARSRIAGLSHHDAEDVLQTTMLELVRHRGEIDDRTDSLQRYSYVTYGCRRLDVLRSVTYSRVAPQEPDDPIFEAQLATSAEQEYFEENHGVTQFFDELLDPKETPLTEEQQELLRAYLETGTWAEACQKTGSSGDPNAAKARGRRLQLSLRKLAENGLLLPPVKPTSN